MLLENITENAFVVKGGCFSRCCGIMCMPGIATIQRWCPDLVLMSFRHQTDVMINKPNNVPDTDHSMAFSEKITVGSWVFFS